MRMRAMALRTSSESILSAIFTTCTVAVAGWAARSRASIIFVTFCIRFTPSVETTSVLLSSSMPSDSLPLKLTCVRFSSPSDSPPRLVM